jgi:hypothetical protein
MGLHYFSSHSFLITLLSEAVAVHCNHSSCKPGICKQVLDQSNLLGKGLAEFLDRGGVNTTQVCDREVIQGCQIPGTVVLSKIR